MSVFKEVPIGREIPRKTVEDICRMLGYNPTNVSSISIPGGDRSGTVEVEHFMRAGEPPTKIVDKNSGGYYKIRAVHCIVGPRDHLAEENL